MKCLTNWTESTNPVEFQAQRQGPSAATKTTGLVPLLFTQLIATFKRKSKPKRNASRLGSTIACEKRDLNCVTRPRARALFWLRHDALRHAAETETGPPQTNRPMPRLLLLRTNEWMKWSKHVHVHESRTHCTIYNCTRDLNETGSSCSIYTAGRLRLRLGHDMPSGAQVRIGQ